MSDLRQKTLSGVRWMAISQAAGQLARFGIAAVLARLIAPPEFGLFQMATVFTSFAALLCDVGLGAALIQRPEVEERQFTATFWLNATIGLALAASLCACSLPLAHFYGRPVVSVLICVVSADIFLSSLAIVHRARLIRAMNYRKLATAELAGVFGGGAIALALAFLHFGVWSLAALVVGTTAFTSAALWRLEPWKPNLVFRGMIQRELLGFGLHLQGFNVINYWLRNLDKFLIGKFFGEMQLGFYMRAYTTMLLPQSQITGVLERVMWPALSRCSGDLPRLRAAYLRALRLVCFISFPLMTGLMTTAADFVRIVYGRGWEESVPVLRLLCIAGLAQSPVATAGWLYLATGRTRRLLAWGIGAGLLIAAGIVAGIVWGSIARIAAIYAATSVVLIVPAFAMVSPCAGLKWREIVRALAGSLAASMLMALAVESVIRWMPAGCHPLPRFIACVAAGGISYAGVVFAIRLPAARDFLQIAREMISGNNIAASETL